jgi:excisionase family DNA binding protein
MKTYLKVSEIAKILEVGDTSVRRWISQGKLPAIRTGGGQYRISVEEFEKFKKDLAVIVSNQNEVK